MTMSNEMNNYTFVDIKNLYNFCWRLDKVVVFNSNFFVIMRVDSQTRIY